MGSARFRAECPSASFGWQQSHDRVPRLAPSIGFAPACNSREWGPSISVYHLSNPTCQAQQCDSACSASFFLVVSHSR